MNCYYSEDFSLILILPALKCIQELVSHGRISILPMHFVFQTAERCGGSQLIERGTRVANLKDFSPKNANLGSFGNQEIFRGILKISYKKWF
jgi:hypothetical protein